MKRFSVLLVGLAFALSAMAADAPGPDWAFMTPDPSAPAPASSRQAAPTDQQPGAPAVVVSGNGAAAPACSICHGASGVGGPQSANLRGQNAEYIVRQMMDFKSGARGGPLSGGGAIAKALTDAETEEAAKYGRRGFSSPRTRPRPRWDATANGSSFPGMRPNRSVSALLNSRKLRRKLPLLLMFRWEASRQVSWSSRAANQMNAIPAMATG